MSLAKTLNNVRQSAGQAGGIPALKGFSTAKTGATFIDLSRMKEVEVGAKKQDPETAYPLDFRSQE